MCIWDRILNLISCNGHKTSCDLMDPFSCFPFWNLMCFGGPKNLMFLMDPSPLKTSCDLMDPKTSCVLMDPLVFLPSENLMCFDGPKNLMCFDGPSTSCDLMDPTGPPKHMSAQNLGQSGSGWLSNWKLSKWWHSRLQFPWHQGDILEYRHLL